MYEARVKWERDQNTLIKFAEKRGLSKGLMESEIRKSRETACSMKRNGYPIEDIAEITGLSLDEIDSL